MSRQHFKGPHAHHTYQCTTGNEYFSNEEGFINGARHISGEHLAEVDPRDLQELERMGVKPTDEVPALSEQPAEDATFENETGGEGGDEGGEDDDDEGE